MQSELTFLQPWSVWGSSGDFSFFFLLMLLQTMLHLEILSLAGRDYTAVTLCSLPTSWTLR